MAYRRKEFRMRETIDIEKSHSGKYGAPGKKREPKRKATPEDILRQNIWIAVKNLKRKINANFGSDDFHLTLTYRRENRISIQDSKQLLKKFLDNLRKEYKKLGQPLKYIVTTEYKNKAIHHHLIVNHLVGGSTTSAVNRWWKVGRPYFVPLDDTGEYILLANYFIKETSKTFQDLENPNKTRYSCSRNLIIPEAKEEIIDSKTWRKEPTARKGYYIDKNSIVEGTNPVTGHRYQYYTLIKLKKRGG